MDHTAPRDGDSEIDLENGVMASEEGLSQTPDSGFKWQAKAFISKVQSGFIGRSVKAVEERASLCHDASISEQGLAENLNSVMSKKLDLEKSSEKEKRKTLSNKKPPKPPRPPRGPSLDAADQKLIKEIAELAMLKRARIERLRALKKAKAAKSSSSSGNVFATVFTVLFCLVIIFQGISPQGASANLQGSPLSSGKPDGGLVSIQYVGTPAADEPNGGYNGSPNLVEQVSGLDSDEKLNRLVQRKSRRKN